MKGETIEEHAAHRKVGYVRIQKDAVTSCSRLPRRRARLTKSTMYVLCMDIDTNIFRCMNITDTECRFIVRCIR